MNDALPEVVSEQEWQKAFDAMLVKEKELTRARDEVAAARRRMPFTPTWAILDVTPFGRSRRPTSGGGCTTSTGAPEVVSRRGPGAARR